MNNKDLDSLLAKKEFRQLFEMYPFCIDVLRDYSLPISGVCIKPIQENIATGSQFSYDSGFNYFSNIIKKQDIYIDFFDIWRDNEDRDTEITFYIPEARQC
jgi:hypothetical protein